MDPSPPAAVSMVRSVSWPLRWLTSGSCSARGPATAAEQGVSAVLAWRGQGWITLPNTPQEDCSSAGKPTSGNRRRRRLVSLQSAVL